MGSSENEPCVNGAIESERELCKIRVGGGQENKFVGYCNNDRGEFLSG